MRQRSCDFNHRTGGSKGNSAEGNARVFKATIAEVPERQHHVDIVLTTANYRQPLEKPYMSVFGLISGVNKANTEKKLEELMKKVAAE